MIVGSASDPSTPRMLTPLLMLLAVTLLCSVASIVTLPPEVYPAGITTDPAFVLIVPPVGPLFAIPPDTDPDDPYPVFPVRTSDEVIFASDVS